MTTTIAKTFTFDAAHQLHDLPEDHKCRRMHGHTYEVTIVLTGKVNAHTGMIIDYADIAKAWDGIFEQLDHRYLNDVPGLSKPTTEVLCEWIALKLAPRWITTRKTMVESPAWAYHGGKVERVTTHSLLDRVTVKESTTTWCTVELADLFADGKTPLAPYKLPIWT